MMRKVFLTSVLVLATGAPGFAAETLDNSLSIEQSGDTYRAYYNQTGTGNTLSIEQTGVDSGASTTTDYYAQIIQTGDYNTAEIQQLDSSYNIAEINQTGDNNDATIYQKTGKSFPNISNYALINQFGEGNQATVAQYGAAHSAYITQGAYGYNTLSLTQNGALALAKVNQTTTDSESGNYLEISQTGYALAVIDDVYYQNTVEATQIGNNTSTSNFIEQDGDANYAYLKQDGDDSVAEISQTLGDWNEARVTQVGSMNSVDSEQIGSYDDLLIRQIGSYNEAITSQTNGDSNAITIEQLTSDNAATITQSGSFLSATILQDTGDSNSIILTQTGNDFSANISQHGSYNIISGSQQYVAAE